MFGKKKFGFFTKLRKVPEVRTEESFPPSSDAHAGSVAGFSGNAAASSPLSGLEIPVIRADDQGAAIDDFRQAAMSSGGADHVSGGSTSPDSTTVISSGCERKVSLDLQSPSPTASVDRLSVSFGPELGSDNMGEQTADSKVRFSKDYLSAMSAEDDDMDYSESLDALMRRRESGRRRSIRRSPKRGSMSPFGSESESGGKGRRRSSTMTSTSCEDTQISIDEHEMTEEQMFESIRLHKELIDQVKKQPWKMRKKLKVVSRAKSYVKKHEGELEQRLAQSKNTKDIMARYSIIFERYWERIKKEAVNLAKNLIPWEMRIKRIESHFGSVVASYFTFIRWLFWINIVMTAFISCFVVVPEVLAADRQNAGDRKELMAEEEPTAFNLQQLWDFEGYLKNSPMFYGYYNNKDKTRQGYRIPFAYFMTLLGMYGYSFAAILRRMAENTRLSKLSDKDEDCTFTWKLYTGWDYMIGNSETADNKVASLLMSFKENILEEREKKKEERNWKIVALRVLANFLVLGLLASSAYAVVLVVRRSQEPEADSGWWRQNEVTVVVSMIGIVYPNIFDIIGTIEHNHPRTQLRYQLARIMILYLLNLYTLIFALFSKVDTMTVKLRLLSPNTTIAPPTLSTSPSKQFFSTSSTDYGIDMNEFSTPLLNISEDVQLPMPGDQLSYLRLALNLTAGYQLWLINATCLAVRVYCRTKNPIHLNDSLYNVPFPYSYSTTSSPTDYYSECPSLLNNSLFLQTTPNPQNVSIFPYINIFSNFTEIPDFNFSLPWFFNASFYETVTLSNYPNKPAEDEKTFVRNTLPNSVLDPDKKHVRVSLQSLDKEKQLTVTTRRSVFSKLTNESESNFKKRQRGRKRDRDRGFANRTDKFSTTVLPSQKGTPSTYRDRKNKKHRYNNESVYGNYSSKFFQITDSSLQTEENFTMATPFIWNDTSPTLVADASYDPTVFPNYTEDFIHTPEGCCFLIYCVDLSAFGVDTKTPTYQSTNITEHNYSSVYLFNDSFTTLDSIENVTDYVFDADEFTISDGLSYETRRKVRNLCWETMFGQLCEEGSIGTEYDAIYDKYTVKFLDALWRSGELVKLTVMDLVLTVANILVTDFFRALFVRVMNHCWFWDLEKQFPGYGDFKIAENILHLVNNQGMIWMGMFFSPGIPGVNIVKLWVILYVRSWAVLTCNIPHETVFKASGSNNFYYALLLTMLFLCTLPVGYAVVWLEPSWHCGPFSQYKKIYHIFTSSLESVLPRIAIRALDYIASPGIVIPLLVLLILVIYYLSSVANSLREANKDLKLQLRRERTEERRKVFQMADARRDPPNSASKWTITKKVLPVRPSKVKMLPNATQPLKQQAVLLSRLQKEDDDTTKTKSTFNSSSPFANVIADVLKANTLKKLSNSPLVHQLAKENDKSSKGKEKPEDKSPKINNKNNNSPMLAAKPQSDENNDK